ncbi:MAG: LLM class F420-dependent oxidoreductase [Pseudomonadales bacterium]|jgi:probable F420-dependent oxidoreductase|nr:LLM class F420-dependent oxidoreductase [Pseudomonadales bacterium]MDP6471106.1 LLM class F420-dependent oxidoreductase [Pseudomonadales bacterium]MDP6825708.1 LLM class F420-dependent oxidoreductase [Pseudomonadales bacterium]MDP6973164.1 LLM class F420-dependent oxidoreductase [Pseudomonadales bacterium]|tara:strand:- start:789 stop:1790 length:1002 start_codon:yes stop_codon:yes gene_type:complete
MALAKRMAVTLPAGPRLTDTIARLQWAEDNGYPDAWFSDAGAPDSLTQVAAIAHHTRNIRIGVAVTPVYTRTPTVLAATANVINQLLPGRFIMGLGSSSETIMGAWNGIEVDKPVTRVKETAIMVRSMLKGEKSDFDGVTLKSKGYRQAPAENPPPIYLAALRPKMIEMAAEFGDGVIFNLWPSSALPKMMEHVKIGAERAGKNWEDVEIVNRAMVLCTDDKVMGRNLFRAAFAPYYATPVYNKFLAWSGHGNAADVITEGWAAKDRDKTTGALSDELIDEIAIIGNEEEIRQRIQQDADGGVHTHIVAPMAAGVANVQRTFGAFTADKFTFK